MNDGTIEIKNAGDLNQFIGWPIVIDGNGYNSELCLITFRMIDLGDEHGYIAYLPVKNAEHMAIRIKESRIPGLRVRPAFLQEIVNIEWSYGYTEVFIYKHVEPAIEKRLSTMNSTIKSLLTKIERQNYEITDLNIRLESLKKWR